MCDVVSGGPGASVRSATNQRLPTLASKRGRTGTQYISEVAIVGIVFAHQ